MTSTTITSTTRAHATKPPASVLFLGDCNTLGTPDIEGRAYPEQFATLSNTQSINCGHTMTTTREGSQYFKRHTDFDCVCVQYGLVDSWLTFKYAPYVLYYPETGWRKIGRKLSKKFKKWCKRLGLNTLIGTRNVVPLEEYRQHLQHIIDTARPRQVVFIETIPNKDASRNPQIRRYNHAMAQLASLHSHCSVLPLYEDFEQAMRAHYSDPTHLSATGHAYVAQKLATHYQHLITAEHKDAR